MKTIKTLLGLLILGISLTASVSHAQVTGMALDQSNDNYGYYFLDRTSGWQSFTAGTNGHLGAVELYFYSTGSEENHSGGTNWAATLRIYEGEGTSGSVLSEQPITGDGVKQTRTFILETPVRQTAGSQYTFSFDSATTGLTVRASGNLYTNGRSHSSSYDYNFKTYVLDSDWSEEVYRDTNFTTSCTIISNEAQLAQFACLVNSGHPFTGQTITLITNLDLSAHYWTPIGTQSPAEFRGTFEGNSNTISGIIIDQPDADYQGLFGHAINGSLRNLDLADVDITGRFYVGGLSGKADELTACRILSGCIDGRGYVGGMVGKSESNITDCVNSASVYSDPAALDDSQHIGGIAGECYGDIIGCNNSGSVEGGISVGGIAGNAGGTLDCCLNVGTITCIWSAGGIAARAQGPVQSCTNSGTVSGTSIGGIVATLDFTGSGTGSVQYCENSGCISGSGAYSIAAGIVADIDGTVQNCINSGAVAGNSAGGISAMPKGVVQNCINSGSVSGLVDEAESDSYAGGIAADIWDTTIRNCDNHGTISGPDTNSLTGGIAGWNEEEYDDGEDYYAGGTILNCANSGAVNGLGLLGGLAGNNGGSISNSYWKQTGIEPFALEATGTNDGTVVNAQPFDTAPGTLASPVTAGDLTTDELSTALNAWMIEARETGAPLRRWTAGSTSAYPTLVNSFWTDAGNYSTNWYNIATTNFTIGTAAELAGLAVLVNDGIDFAGKKFALSSDIELGDREWTPIGFLDGGLVAFSGDFDGNGKTVSGIYVDNPDLFLVGLFGVVSGGHILNLTLREVDVAGPEAAGGLVGYLYFAYAINNSVFGHVTGDFAAGGVAGLVAGETNVLGYIGNCWSAARVSGVGFTGGLSGSGFTENTSISYYSYWKNTGTTPYDKPADGNNGVNLFCYAFAEAPGVLDSAGAPFLSDSLNNFVMNGVDPKLYGWTAGTSSNYPVMIPLIRVDGDYIRPQTLGDNFTAGMSLEQVNDTVSIYTNAHPATDADTFSDLMEQAEIMGFTFADLSTGNAILDFYPTLVLTDLDPIAQELTFTVGNGIDTTAVEAVNRLAQSIAERLSVYQMTEVGGTETVTTPAVQYQTNGTATVSFTPVDLTNTMFFDLQLSHESE